MSEWSPDESLYGKPEEGSGYSESKWSPDASLYHDPIPGDQGSPTLEDHEHYLANVYHNSIAGVHQGLSLTSDDSDIAKSHQSMADEQRDRASESFNAMSSAGQEAASEWSKQHYLHSALFGIEQQVPALVAAGAGTLAIGPAGAPLGFGAVSATDFANSAASAFKQMTPEKIKELHPEYDALTRYMSDDDARNVILNNNLGPGMAVAGAAGVVAGAVPFLGGSLGKRIVTGAATGIATDAITELTLGVTTGDAPDIGDVTQQALKSGAIFGGLSALGGHSHTEVRRSSVQTENRSQLNTEARPGEFTSVGSPTSRGLDRKPQTKEEAAPGVPPRAEATGIAPAPSPVDDAQKSALTGDQDTKLTNESKDQQKESIIQSTSQTGDLKPPEPAQQPAGEPPLTPPVSPPQPPSEVAPAPLEASAIDRPTPEPTPDQPPPPEPSPATDLPPVSSPSVPVSFSPPEEAPTPTSESTPTTPTEPITPEIPTTPFKGKNFTAAEKDARQKNNDAADKVIADHPITSEQEVAALQGVKGERLKFLNTLKTILADAKEQGVKIPLKFKDNTDPSMNHSYSLGLLSEAQRLVNHAAKDGSPAYERFIAHSKMLLGGDEGYKAWLDTRRSEGKEALGKVDLGKKQVEGEPEEVTPRVTIDEQLKTQQAAHMEERRKESEQLKAEQPSPAAAKPAFQVAKTRSLPDKLKQLKADQQARADKFKQEGKPTKAQLEAGNYPKLHLRLEGEDVSVETGKGEEHEPHPVKIPSHYGYIRGTVGKDGDHIDAYIGPKGETGKIFVMNQLARGGAFDEHKVFFGFDNKDHALRAYAHSFDKPKAAVHNIGGIVEMTRDEFKEWLDRGDKSQEVGEGMEGENPEHIITTSNTKGVPTEVQYEEKHNLSEVLKNIDTRIYSKSMRPLIDKLVSRLRDIVKDTPLYTISPETSFKILGTDRGQGFYASMFNHVGIVPDNIPNGTEMAVTIIHEAVHAATLYALDRDPALYDLANKLYNEIDRIASETNRKDKNLSYGFTSPKEMLTEILSNPTWQEFLKDKKMSPELAKALDMPRWRRATLFNGAVEWFRKMLGLGPRDYNVIEAAFNIGERAMWVKQPEQEFGFISRGAVLPKDYDEHGPIAGVVHPRLFTRDVDDIPGKFKTTLQDAMTKGGRDLKQTLFEKGMRFLPMMDVVYGNESKYGEVNEHNQLRMLANFAQKMDAAKQTFQKSFQKPMNIIKNFVRQNPEETEAVHKLLQESDFFNVHPAFDLGEGPNKSIRPDSDNFDHAESIAHHERLAADYDNLSHLGQRVFNTQYNMLKEQKRQEIELTRKNVIALAKEHLSNTIERGDAAEFKTAMDKAINGDQFDLDEEKNYSSDPVIQSIRAANAMLKRNENGFYYPSKRQGKLVVTGKYNFDTGGGVRDPSQPNRIIFPDRESAVKFVSDKIKATGTKEDIYLPSSIQSRHYFLDDGVKKYVPASEARNIEGKSVAPNQEYHVIVNDKHVEFMDNLDEGHKVADALRDLGVQDVKNPVKREENQYLDYSLHGAQVEAFNKAISRMQGISSEAKQAAREAVEHVATASMQGNRLSKTMLTKYRIRGASDDMLQIMDQHLSSTATHIANATYRPQIDKLLQGVKDLAKTAEQSNSPHAYDMSVINSEMENRINGFREGAYGQMGSGLLHTVSVLGLWKYLFSPAHFAMHLMHPVITSIPEMSAEHGWGATYRAMQKAYNDMGGISPTMWAGAKGSLQRAMNFDKMPTDFIDSMRKQLQANGRSAATLRMIDELESTGYFTHNGLEFQPFYQKAGGMTYWADRSLGIIQELNNSAESINRVGTATAAFDLATRKGMSEEAAIDYAKKVLSNTHGLYNNLNRAPMMMSHPVVRSMLQFKTFPMMIYRILGRNVYNIVKGDSKEAQWQAVKALTGMVGTAAFFTGAQGATPELFRLGVTLTNLLGLTDSWETYQDKITRTLASNFGAETAGIVQHGLGHVIGWDLHHRLGIDDGLVFGQPRTSKPADVENWVSNAVLGTPWGLGMDVYTGYQNLMQGNFGQAINMLMPKALVDLNKAYQLGTEGKLTSKGTVLVPNIGPMGLLGQALGFIPAPVAEAGQARAAYGAEQAEIRNERSHISQMWQRGDKPGALAAMRQFNSKYPGQKINIPQIKSQKTLLGYPVTPRRRSELKERASAYGLEQ